MLEKKINATVGNSRMKNVYGPIYSDIRSGVSVKSIFEAKLTCFRSYNTPTEEQEQKVIAVLFSALTICDS